MIAHISLFCDNCNVLLWFYLNINYIFLLVLFLPLLYVFQKIVEYFIREIVNYMKSRKI